MTETVLQHTTAVRCDSLYLLVMFHRTANRSAALHFNCYQYVQKLLLHWPTGTTQIKYITTLHNVAQCPTITVLRHFFRDHPGEPVPEENFWTLLCKGRLTEADTPTTRIGATPSGLTSDHLHHPPLFLFTDRIPFLLPNQQCQCSEDKTRKW